MTQVDWTKVEHFLERKRTGWMSPFFRELVITGDVRLAADAAGIEPVLVVERHRRDPEFAELCTEAFRLRLDCLNWQQCMAETGSPLGPR